MMLGCVTQAHETMILGTVFRCHFCSLNVISVKHCYSFGRSLVVSKLQKMKKTIECMPDYLKGSYSLFMHSI